MSIISNDATNYKLIGASAGSLRWAAAFSTIVVLPLVVLAVLRLSMFEYRPTQDDAEPPR